MNRTINYGTFNFEKKDLVQSNLGSPFENTESGYTIILYNTVAQYGAKYQKFQVINMIKGILSSSP